MRINRISGLVVRRVEWYAPERPIGAVPPKPPEPEPPPADWAGHAQHKRVEDDLQGAARQAELLPEKPLDPVQQILASARKAGLSQTEILQLKRHLEEVPRSVRAEDIKFLRGTVLRCAQPQRALRSFVEMTQIASSTPGRLSRYLAVLLVTGVAGFKSRGGSVLLRMQEASAAARALSGMTDEDFKHATNLLSAAEEPENCLKILKEIAARHDALVNPAIHDHFRNLAGLPGYFLSEVETYAAELLSQTGELNPNVLTSSSLENVQPKEYLKDGFFTPENELRSGIYGYCSAAMAAQWKQKELPRESLRQAVDVLCTLGEALYETAGADPDFPLDDSTSSSLQALQDMAGPGSEIGELLRVAEPHIRTFRDLAALAVHLERILHYMAA